MSNDRSNSHVIKYTIFIPFLIFYSSRGRKMFRFIHLIRFSTSFETYYTWYNNVVIRNVMKSNVSLFFSRIVYSKLALHALHIYKLSYSTSPFKYISQNTFETISLNFPKWIIATILSLIEDTFYTTEPIQDSVSIRRC